MSCGEHEKDSQNWEGMDGAIAWHLIDRHADGWGDVGRMMQEWLDANSLKKQRDELLAALARTRNMIRSNPEAAENCANDAIASVKGQP